MVNDGLPLVNKQFAIENGDLIGYYWLYTLW